jgi:hypothetical protein
MHAIALTPAECELLRRAVSELVDRDGPSPTAINVIEMLERPLQERELLGLREGAEA